MPEATATVEDVAHDDLCPICQLLLFTPVRTQCNHLLCASCMAQWADASTTQEVEHASWDVDLEAFDPNYDPTYDLEANCPMCRTQTRAVPDQALASQLEQKYPITYAERRVEEEVDRGSRVGQDGVEGVMFLIGNKHKLVRGSEDANEHDWTFFVRSSRPDLIQEVRVDLHPTFRPPQVILRRAPYQVRRLGWGTFTLEAEIILKAPYTWVGRNSGATQRSLKLPWTLDFTGRGRQGRVRGGVKRIDQGGRRLRTRPQPAAAPSSDDEEEDDDDYNDDEGEDLSEDEEEDISEFVETPRRR
ncbi:hypothetical protein E8E13_004703 [Curvularia kusanoi]|uniref:Protein AF-9 homolog n=1 Tax=Curvularia kusanoi TaxID=90978 RepID=A0A9P4T832_CURKU|nr:hypothetical protein E8E13_004703 [Curvularia kusanoi]